MVGLNHLVVIVQYAFLENSETLGAIERNPKIHSGFIVFKLGTPGEDAIYGNVERSAEIKSDIGSRREAVKIAQPVRRTSASAVSGKSGVDVAVGQHEVTTVQQRHDLTLAAIGEIGGMQERECCRREQPALFATTGGRFYQRRRVPFGEVRSIAANFEPPFEQVELGALAGTVNALDDHQSAGIRAFGGRLFGRGGISGWRDVRRSRNHMNYLHGIAYHISER